MTLQETVAERVRELSEDDQRRVLEFIQSLAAPAGRKDPRGLYSHRDVHIAAEVIDEARREAWGNFPRDVAAGEDEVERR